jgi:hypothetical protein
MGEAPFNSLRSRGSVDTINQDIDFAELSEKALGAGVAVQSPVREAVVDLRASDRESWGIF